MKKMLKEVAGQTRLEEILNSVSHGLGALLSIAALVLMVVFSAITGKTMTLVSCSIYGVTLITLYLASTCYHFARDPALKKKLKVLDHTSIFLLIAGTYTPFLLVTLNGVWGWSLFGVIWGFALIGIIFKLFFTGRYEYVGLAMYLLMGWIVVIAVKPLMHDLAFGGLMWLVAGGLSYTLGVVFYATDHKYHFGHFLWHLFVLGGSICHFFAIFFYVVL
jgi:hemolysin III